MPSEDAGGDGPQGIELISNRNDFPALKAEMVDRHLLPFVLVGARAVLEAERDGDGSGEAALPGEGDGKGEKRRRVAPP